MKKQEISISNPLVASKIASKIVVVRDVQVLLDRDIAEMYGVEIKVLNQAVKRNPERFPDQFMFQLSSDEYQDVKKSLWSQIVTIENVRDQRGRHTKYLPYAFTEQGVAMLSAVLRSEKAVRVSIEIMNAFVQMRHYLRHNMNLVGRLNAFETKVDAKLVEHDLRFQKIDENFSKIFNELDSNPKKAKEGVFFKGQIFDAYAFFQDIIKTAKKEKKLVEKTVFLLWYGDELALVRREETGLLGGMWSLPNVDEPLDVEGALRQAQAFGVEPASVLSQEHRAHVFTHIRWEMEAFTILCGAKCDRFVWRTPDEIRRRYALPTAFRKFL